MQVRTYNKPYREGRQAGAYERNHQRNITNRGNYNSDYRSNHGSANHSTYERRLDGDRSLLANVNRAMSHSTAAPGDICLVDFGDDTGHCRTVGTRPAICISSMDYNEDSPILRVVPMTRQLKAIDTPYHVFVDRDRCDGLDNSGMAMGEQTIPITRDQIIKKIAFVKDETLLAAVLKAANAINMTTNS